jgi:plastocyanin
MKLTALIATLAFAPLLALANTEVTITIKDHRFTPAEVRVPAGQKIKLIVDNQDATPEEFESHELNREKIIAPKSKASIFIGPLKPGKYPFFGEFNQSTARGVVIAE